MRDFRRLLLLLTELVALTRFTVFIGAVPLLGVAENMSWFEDATGARQHLFGEGGGAILAELLGTSLLGQVPLFADIRAGGDSGQPVTVSAPAGQPAQVFRGIAAALLSRLKVPHAG